MPRVCGPLKSELVVMRDNVMFEWVANGDIDQTTHNDMIVIVKGISTILARMRRAQFGWNYNCPPEFIQSIADKCFDMAQLIELLSVIVVGETALSATALYTASDMLSDCADWESLPETSKLRPVRDKVSRETVADHLARSLWTVTVGTR